MATGHHEIAALLNLHVVVEVHYFCGLSAHLAMERQLLKVLQAIHLLK